MLVVIAIMVFQQGRRPVEVVPSVSEGAGRGAVAVATREQVAPIAAVERGASGVRAEATWAAAPTEFLAWAERYRAAAGADGRRALVAEGVALARGRREVLKALIRTNPAAALAAGVPEEWRGALPAEVTALLEQRVSGVGRLEVRHLDWREGDGLRGETRRMASIDGVRYEAYAVGRRASAVSLSQAFLEGIAIDDQLAVAESPFRPIEAADGAGAVVAEIAGRQVRFAQLADLRAAEARIARFELSASEATEVPWAALLGSGDGGEFAAAETSRSLGPKRVLVLRVDFPDLQGEPTNYGGDVCTPQFLQAVNVDQIAPFYAQCSSGRTSLEFTIASKIYRTARPTTAFLENPTWAGSDALQHDVYAAVGSDHDLAAYDHVVMVFTGLPGYPAGMAGGHDIWISGAYRFSVVAHEIGHNYGWGHANLWVGTTSPIDYAGGTSWEYGDPFDVMGAGSFPDSFGFSVTTMAAWGWLANDQVATATSNATYRIYASDQKGLSPTGAPLLGVKLRQDDSNEYWLSFRSPTEAVYGGFPAGLHLIRRQVDSRTSNLIPLNALSGGPYQEWRRADLILPVGAAFTDPAADVSIEVLGHGGSEREQYLDVRVTFSGAAVAPDVGLQPADRLGVRAGAGALFSTWARAGSPAASYRWQRQAGGTGAWVDLADGTDFAGTGTVQLLVRAASLGMNEDRIRCRLQNSAGVVYTRAARLTVTEVTAGSFTLAGRMGLPGFADGAGAQAQFEYPIAIVFAADGALVVSDARNNRLRRVALDGTVSTLNAEVSSPRGLCVDAAGNLYVADEFAAVIRRYTPAGVTSVYAGQLWTPGASDGDRATARFTRPSGVAIDSAGNLYVTDASDCTVRRVATNGVVSTLAGLAGAAGYQDGTGAAARFRFQSGNANGVAVGPDQAVYVTDVGNHCVRRVGLDGVVTTVVGSPDRSGAADGGASVASLSSPVGIIVGADGTILVADHGMGLLRLFSTDGRLHTLGGGWGDTEGVGTAFRLKSPQAAVIGPNGRLYVADANNSVIRVYVPTVPPIGREPADAVAIANGGKAAFAVDTNGAWPLPQFRWQSRVAGAGEGAWTDVTNTGAFRGASSSQLEISGATRALHNREYRCVLTNTAGTATSRAAVLTLARTGVFTVAGSAANFVVRDGVANDAALVTPRSFSWQTNGTLLFLDSYYSLRTLDSSGAVRSPFALNASGAASDAAGNIYFSDTSQNAIKRVRLDGVVELVAGADNYYGTGAADGAGANARFNRPDHLARASDGTLYVSDAGNGTIRAISATGEVRTVAGTVGVFGTVDGTGAAAQFGTITAMVIAADGNLLVRDNAGSLLRRVTPAGVVTTVAGAVMNWSSVDGQGTAGSMPGGLGGLGLAPDGTVYLAEPATGRIRTYSNGYLGTLRDPEGQPVVFDDPRGIAVDANGILYVGEAGAHRISAYLRPPRIVQGPASVSATSGAAITLSVNVAGTPFATYQWYRNGTALDGATSASFVIGSLSALNAGDYTVEVRNAGGYAVSAPAHVAVGQSQTITFAGPGDRSFTTQPIALVATASSGLPVTFTVVSGSATIEGSALTLTGTGTVIVRASQAGDGQYNPAAPVERSFTVRYAMASWTEEFFTPSERNDASVAGPDADPDRDGANNLVEYALGTDPRRAGAASIEIAQNASDWIFTYTRPAAREDVVYLVEVSDDLAEWSSAGVVQERVASGEREVWRARVMATSLPRVFFRLKVQRVP